MPGTHFDVLVIDDEDTLVSRDAVTEIAAAGCSADFVLPDDLTDDLLGHARVLLVDFKLDSDWVTAKSATPPGRRIRDGLALAACLRRESAEDDRCPVAIALLTNQLEGVLFPLTAERRPHMIARLANVEWAFKKGDPDNARRVSALVGAMKALPQAWDTDPWRDLCSFLGAENGEVDGVGISGSVADAMPPIHDLARWSHGLTIIRWLLHRVFPYPTFLIDDYHLAARLGVTQQWAASEDGTGAIGAIFGRCRYRGALGEFGGPRWWARCVHQTLWEGTDGRTGAAEAVATFIEKEAGVRPEMFIGADPVVSLNNQLEPCALHALLDCVELRPEDWPPFASPAYAARDAVEADARLKALSVREH